tara:strand:+ start:1454 stop:1777 length:324 start_codon:yes stop_codon:yes gene_type:complete
MEGEPIPKKPPAALQWIGILVIISGFFLAVGSIRFTGWFVPTNLDRVYFICGASLLAGGVPIVWHHILREKHLNAIEDHNGKKKWKLWQVTLAQMFFIIVILILSLL